MLGSLEVANDIPVASIPSPSPSPPVLSPQPSNDHNTVVTPILSSAEKEILHSKYLPMNACHDYKHKCFPMDACWSQLKGSFKLLHWMDLSCCINKYLAIGLLYHYTHKILLIE